jgi:hypothetical protein
VDQDRLAVDDKVSINDCHAAVVLTVSRVILEQVRLKLNNHQKLATYHVRRVQEWIVHGDNLNRLLEQGRAEDETTDAAEAGGQNTRE